MHRVQVAGLCARRRRRAARRSDGRVALSLVRLVEDAHACLGGGARLGGGSAQRLAAERSSAANRRHGLQRSACLRQQERLYSTYRRAGRVWGAFHPVDLGGADLHAIAGGAADGALPDSHGLYWERRAVQGHPDPCEPTRPGPDNGDKFGDGAPPSELYVLSVPEQAVSRWPTPHLLRVAPCRQHSLTCRVCLRRRCNGNEWKVVRCSNCIPRFLPCAARVKA